MKPFAVDIDDVIALFAQAIYPAMTSRYQNVKPVAEWHSFRFSDVNNIPYDAFIQAMIDDDLLSNCHPVTSAIEAMKQIHASGTPIVLITARGYHAQAYALTAAWLAKHDIPYDDLIIVPKGLNKAEASKDKYPKGFIYMIDDNPDNLDDMREAGLVTNTILIDQPWNQDRKDFKIGASRFKSLWDFVQSLKISPGNQYNEIDESELNVAC